MAAAVPTSPPQRTLALLTFVLVSFAANSLITRYVVANHLLDAYLLTVVRFVAGAVALLAIAVARRERPSIGRANLRPALWLGVYAVCISSGYQHIGAAAGTFVFYATVLAGLVAYDLATGNPVPRMRAIGAVVSLTGVAVLTAPGAGEASLLGVVLLAATGAAWALYTAAGPTVTGAGLLWAVVMGAVTTALSYVAWYAAQRRMSATTAGSVQLVIPILTAAGHGAAGRAADPAVRRRGGPGLRRPVGGPTLDEMTAPALWPSRYTPAVRRRGSTVHARSARTIERRTASDAT